MKCSTKIRIYTKDEKEVGFRKREIHIWERGKGKGQERICMVCAEHSLARQEQEARDAQSNISKNKEKLMLWTGWEIKVNGIGELENNQ